MTDLVDNYLAHRFAYRPVDATFMGFHSHDDFLPPVGPTVIDTERAGNAALADLLAAAPDAAIHPHDRAMLLAELEVEHAALALRPRHHNPAWYMGEAGFGVISLLLPQSAPWRVEAIAARIDAIPAYLAAGLQMLENLALPLGWVGRAQSEALVLAQFLRADIRHHPAWRDSWAAACERGAVAIEGFGCALSGDPNADPACGLDHLSLIMSRQHALNDTPAVALRRATEAFARTGDDLIEMARRIDPDRSWEQQIAALSSEGPALPEDVMPSYRDWDERAKEAALGLVTPERGYLLDYRLFPDWAANISKSLYFLFYRSPPALDPGQGSVYWVSRPGDDGAAYLAANNTAMVKTIHAVHHGSVGHHTQNARARASLSRLGRIAGTDCAMGLAFLGSGTLIEGWACYVEDLLMEADGFYTPTEMLLLKSFERRNAASVMVDVNIHTGEWSLAEAQRFYAEEAGFALARVGAEVVRNSMFPGSRLMYWLGVDGIRHLRSRWRGTTQAFHDRLLSYGHVPLAYVVAEMLRGGELDP